jgi:hypothetical protein
MENLTQNKMDVRGDEKSPARFTCINCKFRGPRDECLRPSSEIPCYYGSPLEEVPEIYRNENIGRQPYAEKGGGDNMAMVFEVLTKKYVWLEYPDFVAQIPDFFASDKKFVEKVLLGVSSAGEMQPRLGLHGAA